MSLYDPKSGFRRQLSYEETLNLVKRQNADAGKTLLPGMERQASRFVQSPFFERLKETVYEDMKSAQLSNQMVQQNQANLQTVAAQTGVPPQMMQGPPGPSGPPGPPGPPGGGHGSGPRKTAGKPGGGRFTKAGREAVDSDAEMSRGPSSYRDSDNYRDRTPRGGDAAGATAVASTSFAGITPETTAQVNDLRLQAELHRLQQVNDNTERRAMTAENVANMLHQQRMNNPAGTFIFGGNPPPPPAPVVTPTVKPQEVAKAIREAMQGEKRNLQELMTHHGKSMKQTVQEAVSTRVAAPATQHVKAEVVGAQASVSMPAASASVTTERKAKREATLAKRPLSMNVEQDTERKRKRDASTDLEDVVYYERSRSNPAAAKEKEEKKAKTAKRREILAGRPITFGPDQYGGRKRPADAIVESEKRSRANPAIEKERFADLAREALAKVYKQQTGVEKAMRTKQLERVQREGVDIIRKSRSAPIRMDQFDLKREVDQIYDDLAQSKIGTSISEIVVPKRANQTRRANRQNAPAIA